MNEKEILSQTSIAIVGSAPYKEKLGSFIDQFETVIRFNNFRIEGHEEYIGSKTTIWCYASNNWDKLTQPNPFEIIWAIPRIIPISESMREQARKLDVPMIEMPKFITTNITNRLGKKLPSVGVLGIANAIEIYDEPLFVTGFDNFVSTPRHYYHEIVTKAEMKMSHSTALERKLILNWRLDGKVLPPLPLLL